jgi:hypothetical protein
MKAAYEDVLKKLYPEGPFAGRAPRTSGDTDLDTV